MKYKEKGRQRYNYLQVYEVDNIRNIYQILFEDPLKNKMRRSMYFFFKKREFTLFKILFVKIKVILSLIHTNTEQ